MGSRINHALVRRGGYRLFYSHWGAQSVDVEDALKAAGHTVATNPEALADHHGPELGDEDRREALDRLFEKFRSEA